MLMKKKMLRILAGENLLIEIQILFIDHVACLSPMSPCVENGD